MSTAGDCLRSKHGTGGGGAAAAGVVSMGVATIGPEAFVLDAARAMNDRKIGSLVVTTDGRDAVGIITERDILTRIVAAGRDPRTTKVREVMTRELVTCAPGDALEDLRRIMKTRRIRHIPVIENGRLAGMVSLGDLNAVQAEEMSQVIVSLEEYIQRG